MSTTTSKSSTSKRKVKQVSLWASEFSTQYEDKYPVIQSEALPSDLKKQVSSAVVKTKGGYPMVTITLKSGKRLGTHLLDFDSPAKAGDKLLISTLQLRLRTNPDNKAEPYVCYYGEPL